MDKRILIIVFVVPFLVFWHWFEPAAQKNGQGISSFQEGKYEEALKQFLSAKGIKPDLAALKNNTASALYQMEKYKEAFDEFSSIDPEKAKIPKSDFYYNLGNSFYRLEQLDKALASYKKALLENPADINTKKNFELTLQKIQQQKQDQKDQKQDQEQDKKEQEKNEQQKQEKQEKHENVMQYLNQKEQKQMKEKKRQLGVARNEKDW